MEVRDKLRHCNACNKQINRGMFCAACETEIAEYTLMQRPLSRTDRFTVTVMMIAIGFLFGGFLWRTFQTAGVLTTLRELPMLLFGLWIAWEILNRGANFLGTPSKAITYVECQQLSTGSLKLVVHRLDGSKTERTWSVEPVITPGENP